MGEARVLLPAPFARVLYFTARTLGVSHWQDRERICAQGHGLSRKGPESYPGSAQNPAVLAGAVPSGVDPVQRDGLFPDLLSGFALLSPL